jgi:hydroxyethylthiazole kinase-like uncharacterized protein yjeF
VKPVLSPEEAAELDRAAQAGGVPAAVLMERAGRAVARAAVDLTGGAYGRRAVVVAGSGNNGGDGFVAARHLARWGMRVDVEVLGEATREPAAGNLSRLAEVGVVPRSFAAADLEGRLARADVAIDALFGTGFHGPAEGDASAAIAVLNGSEAPAVAVDIPSGVDGATGAVTGAAVRAEVTVTFGAAKLGAVLMPGAGYAGAVRVVDIGFGEDLVRARAFLTEPGDLRAAMPVRGLDTHKRASGVLVVVAGSRGMPGAARLIATAAGRIGAGLVVVALPASALSAIASALTESVFVALPETDEGTVAADAIAPMLGAIERADALAIGPGLTTNADTAGFVREFLGACPIPAVVDADGLNAFAGRAAELSGRSAPTVLTPHVGEAARLTGVPAAEIEADRLRCARDLAARSGAVALVKGTRSVIAEPDGTAWINPTGGSVLATAGSGDVLTGTIGGLLARGLDPREAATCGAYVHGLAGILAGRSGGEGVLAGDLAALLPEAVARLGAT